MVLSSSSVLLLLVLTISLHHRAQANTFVYAGCSPTRADPSSPFLPALSAFLSSSSASSAASLYAPFSDPSSPLYGLYDCRSDLSLPSCASCVRGAAAQLALLCPLSPSAALQLDGCLLRYSSSDNFLGAPDTTLVFKKCSPAPASGDGSGDFFRRRDDVLADLRSGAGFRVSRAGTVQGYAQCVGDVAGGDCSACLAAAVDELERACGPVMAAEVYLGQCYAKYWASGYYSGGSPGSESSDDDVGRTVAIIVGILAGLAVVVVFLSFLRKALG